MNTSTGLTENPGKSRLFSAVCAGTVTLIVSFSANAAFVITGGSIQGLPVADNDFNSNLIGEGYNQMTTGAQLGVDMDGSVTFYYLAAESGYTNSFNYGSGSPISITENNDSFDWDGWYSFSIDVAAGDKLDFSFTSANASALTPVDNASGSNLEGLGIIAGESMSELVLAYNDNYLGFVDSDFDDMLVRVEFSPIRIPEIPGVPVPAAVWLFCSGLLGLTGMACRRKQ
jgi:hypothetical protein